jgi:hypothetical protein
MSQRNSDLFYEPRRPLLYCLEPQHLPQGKTLEQEDALQ